MFTLVRNTEVLSQFRNFWFFANRRDNRTDSRGGAVIEHVRACGHKGVARLFPVVEVRIQERRNEDFQEHQPRSSSSACT